MADPHASPRPVRRVDAPTVATWAARVAWLLVAVLGGAAVGGALDGRSDTVRLVGAVGAWSGWAVTALALAVPSVPSLTVVRAMAPAALAVAATCAGAGAEAAELLALALPAGLATIVIGSAELGRAFVQASSYGDEERFPLRPPIGYLAAASASWAVMVAASIAAPLGWAAAAWAVAAPATLVVVGGALALPRRWHQLSRRWLVLVPAGLVVHDPVVLAETLLLRRPQIAGVRLALRGSDAADLTGPTPGVAVEVATTAMVTTVFAPTPRQPTGRAIHLRALIVAPSRPGAVLTEAGRRRLPVG